MIVSQQLLHRTYHHALVEQDGDAVAHGVQAIQVVGHHQDRQAEAATEALDQLVIMSRADRIQSRRRLVQEQHFGIEGERPGEAGILEIGANNQMEAVAEVYESDIGRVRLGQTVTLTSENGGFEGRLEATVLRISPQVRQRQVLSTDPTGDAASAIAGQAAAEFGARGLGLVGRVAGRGPVGRGGAVVRMSRTGAVSAAGRSPTAEGTVAITVVRMVGMMEWFPPKP